MGGGFLERFRLGAVLRLLLVILPGHVAGLLDLPGAAGVVPDVAVLDAGGGVAEDTDAAGELVAVHLAPFDHGAGSLVAEQEAALAVGQDRAIVEFGAGALIDEYAA